MTKTEILRLLAAMDWSRERMFDSLQAAGEAALRRPLGGSFGSLQATLAHMFWAERTWAQRLTGTAPAGGAAAEDLAGLRADWAASAAALRDWVTAQPPDVSERVIRYRNTKGQENATPVADIILQVSHHQAYHRGQIAHMLRQLGLQPAATDYIAFFREQQSKA